MKKICVKSITIIVGALLIFSFPLKIRAASCLNTCPTPTPCPTVTAGTGIENTTITPPSVPKYQCCKNPDNVNTAEEWANYLGISASQGTDTDIRKDFKWYHNEPPECDCEEVWNDPSSRSDPLYKEWSGTVDLTKPDTYELTCRWYNLPQISGNCQMNVVEEKTKTCPITVIEVAPSVDPIPSPGTPIPRRLYNPEDCPSWYHMGWMEAYPFWEELQTVHSACCEKIDQSVTLSIKVTGGFSAGVKLYLVAIIGGSWATTTSWTVTAYCSAISCKRRTCTLYQKGWYLIRSYNYGKCEWNDDEQRWEHLQPTGNCEKKDYIWKSEMLANCGAYVMATPTPIP